MHSEHNEACFVLFTSTHSVTLGREHATLGNRCMGNTTPGSVCAEHIEEGCMLCAYVRAHEWAWSPAGGAYSLTQSDSESKQSPQPGPVCCSNTLYTLLI